MKNGSQWTAVVSVFDAYVRQTGNGLVPANYPENPQLGRWVAMIRYRRKVGELDPAFVADLDRKGFVWSATELSWDKMFGNLRAFRTRFGHCDVPTHWADSPGLGTWVARQRHLRLTGILRTERTRRLAAIGFRWHVQGVKDVAIERQQMGKWQAAVAARSEQRLFHIGASGYVQYGTGELPAALQQYLAVHKEWPPYIQLPTVRTQFVLKDERGVKDRRIEWKGHGPLPGEVMAYVGNNGCLPL